MAKKHFTSKEMRELVFEGEVEREEGDNGRWSRHNKSIVLADDGKHYAINWEEGLTEMQDDEFYESDCPEVEKVTYEKTITVTEWKSVK